MKCNVSIPERMKDLRVERHLSLEELEAAVGISKSALGGIRMRDNRKRSPSLYFVVIGHISISQ